MVMIGSPISQSARLESRKEYIALLAFPVISRIKELSARPLQHELGSDKTSYDFDGILQLQTKNIYIVCIEFTYVKKYII